MVPVLGAAWPRYWAKMFDVMLLSSVLLWGFIAFGPIRAVAKLPTNEFLLGALVLPFAVIAESLIYAATGHTVGKWILGLRVLRIDQRRLPVATALSRNLRCWVFGLGFGFPLISLFTLMSAHSKAKKGEAQSWDLATESRCYAFDSSTTRTTIGALLTIALMVGVRSFGAYSHTPRGTLEISAMAVNASAPVQLDPETRLDGATGEHGRFQYLYTLTKYEPTAPGAAGELGRRRANVYAALHKAACTAAELADIRATGATIQYTYRDRLGATAMDFVIAPTDCATDGELLATAAEVNAMAPKTLDEYTRLDGATAAGRTIRYLYTLTVDVSQAPAAALAEFRANMRDQNTRRVCSDGAFASLRRMGGTAEFVYRDTAGSPVIEVVAATSACR
jgi:hypothetical protein